MRYVSLFSGIEAASVACDGMGWEPLAFAEIDQFPSAVLKQHFPQVPNLGDVTKVDWRRFVKDFGKPDLIVGGSPCFPAGTLILREDGYVPIEEIRVGDTVVSHTGKLRKVLATGSKFADTVLTPRECERLQGFPDDWTLIPYRGKPAEDCPDGPRYKAIGNSMAVPVMKWIFERMEAASNRVDAL